MVRKDPRVEYDRQEVLALVGSAWREPVNARYLGRFNPRYEVPGRNEDGSDPNHPSSAEDTGPLAIAPPPDSPPETSTARQILKVIGYIVFGIFLLLIWLVVWISKPYGQRLGHRSWRQGEPPIVGKVTGGPNCFALPFADTARANPGRLWLAWSPSWLALVSSTGQSHVLWHCRGNARPALDQRNGRLVWADGSVVSF